MLFEVYPLWMVRCWTSLVGLSLYCLSPGFFCIRYPESMLEPEIKKLYNSWLTQDCGSLKKIEVCSCTTCRLSGARLRFLVFLQVLRNFHNYLKEVETKLKTADSICKCQHPSCTFCIILCTCTCMSSAGDMPVSEKTDLLQFGDQHSR